MQLDLKNFGVYFPFRSKSKFNKKVCINNYKKSVKLQTLENVLASLVTGSWEIYQEQSLNSPLFQN